MLYEVITKRAAVEELKDKLLCSYRREKSSEEMVTCEFKNSFNPRPRIAVCVFNIEQERAARKFGVDKIYKKGIDVARESQVGKIDLDSELASNLYQLLENKSSAVTVDWNQNIGNSYALDYFSGMDKVGLVYLSPELDLESLAEIVITSYSIHYTKLYDYSPGFPLKKRPLRASSKVGKAPTKKKQRMRKVSPFDFPLRF